MLYFWQRLSSSGYVFSASLPPYLASAAITAIDVLDETPDLITKLRKNIATLHQGFSHSFIHIRKNHILLPFLLRSKVYMLVSHYLMISRQNIQDYQTYRVLRL